MKTWRTKAACATRPDLFEAADAVARPTPATIHAAMRVCLSCPVIDQCLDDALEHETGTGSMRFSIRGGLTGDQRAELHDRRVREGKASA